MLMDSLSKEQKDQMLEEIAYFFNEEFDAREMGRIMQIVTDNTFANDKTALADFIDVLNDYGKTPKDNQYGDMSDEELLKLVQKLKEKKK